MTEPATRTGPVAAVVGGRYRITAPIGEGGRAVVYAAEDRLLRREVAVKVFRSDASAAEDLNLQEAEARLVARMNHHALTTLFDAGVDTSDPARPRIYLVMERIPGVDLKRRLAAHGPLCPMQLAYLGFDLAEGLQFVHEHGFLHRDLKPANVLLADRAIDVRLRGKLTDFGIAASIGTREVDGLTTGTAAYLSPEQAEGHEATPASDVYALGLVLLEALTGVVAFPGDVEESVFARLDRDPAVPASVPPALADVLRAMTAREPADRPTLEAIAPRFQLALLQELVDTGAVQPSAEARRLEAVRRYDILDTPPDEAFDRVAHLARRLLDVPVAVVTITDERRTWSKAADGAPLGEVPRADAVCAGALASGRPIAVEDLQAGAFAGNPLVTAHPELHGFAAAPLLTRDGQAIGTICVFSQAARRFTEEELGDLQDLAAMAVRELDFRAASRRRLFAD